MYLVGLCDDNIAKHTISIDPAVLPPQSVKSLVGK
jgi:hypothetical protein